MEDGSFSQNGSVMTASSADVAQQELGQIPRRQLRSKITQDALMFGYQFDNNTRYYYLLKSKIPLSSSQRVIPVASAKALFAHLAATESLLQRAATQSEAEGYANAAFEQHRSTKRATYLGYGIGGYFAYRRALTFRFPFFTPPDPSFFASFPSPRLPLLQGYVAKMVWHLGVRFPLYAACSLLVSEPFGNFWGAVRAHDVMDKDSRTMQTMKDMANAKRIKISRPDEERRAFPKKAPNQTQKLPELAPERPLSGEPMYQEMDQNVKAFEDLNQDSNVSSLATKEPNDYGATTVRSRGMQGQPSPSSKGPVPQEPVSYEKTLDDQIEGSTGSFYDDGGSFGKSRAEADTPDPAGGSAWDRIRSGNSARGTGSDPNISRTPRWESSSARNGEGSSQIPHKQSPWGNRSRGRDLNDTKGDSFSFSKSDEERALAKEQAQKEFDAMIEAERKGGDAQTVSEQGGQRRGFWGSKRS